MSKCWLAFFGVLFLVVLIGGAFVALEPSLVMGFMGNSTKAGEKNANKPDPPPKETEQAVRYWIDALKNPETKEEAKEGLAKLGPSAIPAIMKALKERENMAARFDAQDIMAQMGPPAIPFLIEEMKKGDFLQDRASLTLGKMGKPAVPELVKLLDNKDDLARGMAAQTLGIIGPAAKEAVPALIAALKNPKDDLAKIKPPANARGLNRQGGRSVYPFFARALGRIGPDAKAAVPALREKLKHEDFKIRLSAVEALGKIGPEAKEASLEIAEALTDGKQEVILAALFALKGIGPAGKGAVPALIQRVEKEKVPQFRLLSMDILGGMGPEAKEAVPALLNVSKENDPIFRKHAVAALKKIDPEKAPKEP